MRSPEELDAVDWAALEHAYGPAGEVPGWIRALYAEQYPEADSGELVLDELVQSIHHQGSVYSATVAAVPFLAHLAVHADFHRAAALYLLTCFAEEQDESSHNPLSGPLRSAVLAELPALTGCLIDPSPFVRQQAIRLAVVGPRPPDPAVVDTLSDLYARDPDPWTRADALTALTLIDPDQEAARHREAMAFGHHVPEVRLSAALLGLERAQRPFPAALVDIVAVDGASDLGCYWATARPDPFPYPGPPDGRLGELLVQDPDAALTVAEAWIAAGDVDYRGSDLADDTGTAWRDREPRIAAALAGAVPLPRAVADDDWMASKRHAWLMGQLAAWMSRSGDPGPHVRDMLLAELGHAAPEPAASAQLALGLCGDLRLLEQNITPTSRALAALLTHHGPTVPQLLHSALEEYLPQGAPVLLDALTSVTAHTYAPHIAAAFGNRPSISAAQLLGALDPALVDSSTLDLLGKVARDSDREVLRAAAAVSHATLTGQPEAAIGLLHELLAGDSPHWILPHAGRLGPLGAPLAARVEELFARQRGLGRVEAADAYWRITADPAPVVPVLVELALPGSTPHPGDRGWHRLDALRTLANIGITPPELLPLLEVCARSPRRVAHVDKDDELRQTAIRLLAQAG